MSIFSKFFKNVPKTNDPKIQFGRFTDTYKTDEKYKIWDAAIEHFENEKYLTAYGHLFDFLSLENADNVIYKQGSGKLSFIIYQGSKIIEGEVDFKLFRAEAKIVEMKVANLGLMRMLLESNFELKYSRFAIDEHNCLCLKFDTFVEDGSPHKIYQALKELATEADRKDDVLMHEYEDLVPVNHHHTRQVSENEIKIKYEYVMNGARSIIKELESGKLNSILYPGGVSFLLLDFIYRIDFLIKPEGTMMDKVKEIHELYFNDNLLSVHDKNKIIIKEIRIIEKMTYINFAKEIYEVNCTFGTSMPEGHQRLIEIVDAQMADFDWYYENRYFPFAKAICGYVVGFSLYSFALPEPTRALLIFYYKITEQKYFIDLGFGVDFVNIDESLKSTNIVHSIKSILKDFQPKYGQINVETKTLQYDDPCLFCKSYLKMVRNLEYPEY